MFDYSGQQGTLSMIKCSFVCVRNICLCLHKIFLFLSFQRRSLTIKCWPSVWQLISDRIRLSSVGDSNSISKNCEYFIQLFNKSLQQRAPNFINVFIKLIPFYMATDSIYPIFLSSYDSKDRLFHYFMSVFLLTHILSF